MNITLLQSRFLITLLTSSNEKLLKLSYESIEQQKNHYLDYNIVIIVNSTHKSYYESVVEEFKDNPVEIIETISNGKPGKGHNSVLQYFKNNPQYDYLIPIDGDDFLYPYALHQITKAIITTQSDILGIQGHDILSWYNDSNSTADIYLNNSFYLIKQDEYPDNKWKFNKELVKKNPFTFNKFVTPIRLILTNRKIFTTNITEFYCEKSYVMDDYLFYLHFIQFHFTTSIHTSIINSNHIYLYNDLSITSVHTMYSCDKDYKCIQDYKPQFSTLEDYLTSDWDVLQLPYTYIQPPFKKDDESYYNVVDDTIQITNYNTYIETANVNYCINYAKSLCIKIYTSFKDIINIWLMDTQFNKCLELSQKLIDNGITDREIYIFLCISAHFLKKKDIIQDNIRHCAPLHKNYSYLSTYTI